jgi:uncharacterized protein
MRSNPGSWCWLLLAGLIAVTSCRRADRTPEAEPARPAAEAVADPWTAIPRDSLYGATAVENLRVQQVEIEMRGIPRGWDGMRIAVLSDFLLGLWPDNAQVAEAAARRAVELNPDLIVLLGDYVAATGNPALLDQVLAPLRGRATLAVLGDRDLRSDTLANLVAARLRGHGVRVLRNELVAFVRGPDTAFIAGIEPAYTAFTAEQQAQLFAALPEGAAIPLLLSHLPTVLPQLPANRVRVVLAGHVFCGQIEIPGTPRLAAVVEEALVADLVPHTQRLFRRNESTMFVSCGLGYSFVPARFAPPPEVALVTLVRIPDARPEAPDTLPPAPAEPPAEQPAPAPEPEPEPT